MSAPVAALEAETQVQGQIFFLTDRQGTGFFVSSSGLALTAWHLVGHIKEGPIQAKFRDGDITLKRIYPGKATDDWQKEHDVAILQAYSSCDSISPAPCLYVPLNREKEWLRFSIWAGHRVGFLGFPAAAQYAFRLVHGMISFDAICDARVNDGSGNSYSVRRALAVRADYTGVLRGLVGMSGAPLYDSDLKGIIGVVFAVDDRIYATELVHLFEACSAAGEPMSVSVFTPPATLPVTGGDAREIAQHLHEAPPTQQAFFPYALARRYAPPRIVWVPFVGFLLALLLWRIWPTSVHSLTIDINRLDRGTQEPLRAGMLLHREERLRFSVRSPVAGSVYLIDQELGRDPKPGPPILVFPTKRTREGQNFVKAGEELLFPDPMDDPPYIKLKSVDPDYKGELFTTLVFARPLRFEVPAEQTPIKTGMIPGVGEDGITFHYPNITEQNGATRFFTQLTDNFLSLFKRGPGHRGIIQPEPEPVAAVPIRILVEPQ